MDTGSYPLLVLVLMPQVIMIHIKHVHREDLLKSLTRKMAPPLGEST